jgi:hypothetical protein
VVLLARRQTQYCFSLFRLQHIHEVFVLLASAVQAEDKLSRLQFTISEQRMHYIESRMGRRDDAVADLRFGVYVNWRKREATACGGCAPSGRM